MYLWNHISSAQTSTSLFILFCNHQEYFVIFFLTISETVIFFLFLLLPCLFCALLLFCFLSCSSLLCCKSFSLPFWPHTFIPNPNFVYASRQCLRSISQLPLYPVASISIYTLLGTSFVLVVESIGGFLIVVFQFFHTYLFGTVLHALCFLLCYHQRVHWNESHFILSILVSWLIENCEVSK